MSKTLAQAIAAKDEGALEEALGLVVKPRPDNFVERPWGGRRLFEHKGLEASDYPELAGTKLGEAFELAACPSDPEARAHPSRVPLPDGSVIGLPELIACAPERILGSRSGAELPLLPKTLDVAELLSVQAHPPGNVEAYVVIAADPGATLRLGFAEAVDGRELAAELKRGRARQGELLAMLEAPDAHALDGRLRAELARREGDVGELVAALAPELRPSFPERALAEVLADLKALYWRQLDRLNAIPVRAGQVIFNATPARQAAERRLSAEVHALGNPEGKEMLILEIRRPGPTLRAWDHVRFPLRELDIDGAVASVGLYASAAEDFEVAPRPKEPGVWRSVACPMFVLDHLRPAPGVEIHGPGGELEVLCCIAGRVELWGPRGASELCRGESALVPACHGGYRMRASEPAEVIRVGLGGTAA